MKESEIFTEQNLTEEVHFVYRVIIDGYYYIGKRSGLLDDLHTGAYETSSKLVKEKLKNGKTFSKIKILKVFSTEKEAYEFEEKFLTRVNARRNPKFLNQSNGGKNFYNKEHTEETKAKISKSHSKLWDKNTEQGIKRREHQSEKQRNNWDENTELGRKLRENVSEKSIAQFDINTEQGRNLREHLSKKGVERFNPETEEGRKRRNHHSEKSIAQFDINTEQGRNLRENQSEFMKEYFNPNTEQGRKRREHISNKRKEYFNPNTEEGRLHLEENRRRGKERFNPETEEGRKNLEKRSQLSKAQFEPNTERGRKNLEKQSQISLARFDKNTEEGRKRCEILSKSQIEYFNPNTEQGRRNREHLSNKRKEKAKEELQKRINDSILGELMFNEDFIKQNFLITDDKNNQRFLWVVYSKLTGYSGGHIKVLKRKGKLSFLHGITSISISEEQECAKIEEIKAIIKSRNEREK